MVKDFLYFVRQQGVIGMAVGLAIGVQIGQAVNSIVDNLIDPLVGFMLGGTDLSKLVLKTGLTRNGTELQFGWGAVANNVLSLMAVAFVVYWLVQWVGLDKLDKKK